MRTLLDYLNQYLDQPIYRPEPRCGEGGYFRHIQRRMPVFKQAESTTDLGTRQKVIVNLLIPEGSLVYVPLVRVLAAVECREYRLAFVNGRYLPVSGPGYSSHFTKLRFSQAQVHSIADMSGNPIHRASSLYNPRFKYTVGATIRPRQPFSLNYELCDSGIHAFLTVTEAATYRF